MDEKLRQEYVKVLRHRCRELTQIIAMQGELCDELRGSITNFMDGECKDITKVKHIIHMYNEVAADQQVQCTALLDVIDRLEANGGCVDE